MNVAVIAAAVAASHAAARRREEDRRRRHRQEEERRRREQEDRRRREEERRRREQEDRRRREEERRKREIEAQKRRAHDLLQRGKNEPKMVVEPSTLAFTDRLVFDAADFPAVVSQTEFETQYADGSYSTRENYAHNSYEHGYYSYVLRFHFPDGTERTYDMKRDTSYKSSKETATLLEERLPDGRIRTYDMAHHLMFERDADGNYKSYEKLNNGEIVLVEEGNKDGWQKRYEHKLKSGKVDETEEIAADGKYQIFDAERHLLEEGDDKSYRKYLPDTDQDNTSEKKGRLVAEKFVDGTECRWSDKGIMTYESLPTGEVHEWTDEGLMTREKLPDGTEYCWSDKGIMTYESLPTGELHKWNAEGIMTYEKLTDGTETRWNDQGVMTYESLPTGELHKWNAEGIMTYEKLPDRTETHWNDQGQVTYHATRGVEDTKHYLAEQAVEQKIEKVHKTLKEKGIIDDDKSDTQPVTHLGKALKSVAIKRMERKLSK